MSGLKEVRTSLAVGFPTEALPECFIRFRGQTHCAIAGQAEFPYEDAQFDVVFLAAPCVTVPLVKESHRVLRADGCLFFVVPERTKNQQGFTLPDLYSVVRNGFNIVSVERPPWWRLWHRTPTLTICAQKKFWKSYVGYSRGGSAGLSPLFSMS